MKRILLSTVFFMSVVALTAQKLEISRLGQKMVTQKTSRVNYRSNSQNAIWEQNLTEAESKFSIVSSYFAPINWGIYVADDFKLDGETTIQALKFYGSQYEADSSFINGISLYIYKDDNGKPAGNPGVVGSEFYKVTGIPVANQYVDIQPGEDAFLGNKIYKIDLAGYLSDSLVLPEGTYWLSVVFELDLTENDPDKRWLWTDSENDQLSAPQVIDPTNDSGLNIPTWTDIDQVGFPVVAMAFTIYGETEALAVPQIEANNVVVYPNPTTNRLTIELNDGVKIQQVTAYDMQGRRFDLSLHEGSVNVSQLSAGVYVVKLKTSAGVMKTKLVKK